VAWLGEVLIPLTGFGRNERGCERGRRVMDVINVEILVESRALADQDLGQG
jgi:hypothetical protein